MGIISPISLRKSPISEGLILPVSANSKRRLALLIGLAGGFPTESIPLPDNQVVKSRAGMRRGLVIVSGISSSYITVFAPFNLPPEYGVVLVLFLIEQHHDLAQEYLFLLPQGYLHPVIGQIHGFDVVVLWHNAQKSQFIIPAYHVCAAVLSHEICFIHYIAWQPIHCGRPYPFSKRDKEQINELIFQALSVKIVEERLESSEILFDMGFHDSFAYEFICIRRRMDEVSVMLKTEYIFLRGRGNHTVIAQVDLCVALSCQSLE